MGLSNYRPLHVAKMSNLRKRVCDDLQINVIYAQFLQTRVQRRREVSDVGQHFGHDVEFLARNPGLLDRSTELSLGLVDLGAIEVVVAEIDGHFGAVDACLVELRFVASLIPGSAGPVA